ncbi:lysophospholipid acyltransferase family protein [Allorhizocola rhizosphaerae]|uniref:lysophospholipid acyltransferase family protein n=1 Tax=Allorhizocola rhizosphaerae TaxID=1872709 RepID=UPI001FEA502C|nr:lysophospholipid acyltransferase family protein [Allorhizocola rhizosphaerae]
MKQPTSAAALLVTRCLSRLSVTGIDNLTTRGACVLASNHISPFDPVVLTAATGLAGAFPAFMSHPGPFQTPILGWLMRRWGHIRVDRDTPNAPQALHDAVAVLGTGRSVLIYPEGRISRDPGLWPEKGKTGVGRLVLATGAPVIPVAVWGAHEVVPYDAPRGMWPRLWHSLRHKPTVKVHFGLPVDLSGIDPARPGAAQKATDRVMDAVTAALEPLRADEPDLPRYIDPTRPVTTARSRRIRS